MEKVWYFSFVLLYMSNFPDNRQVSIATFADGIAILAVDQDENVAYSKLQKTLAL